MRWTTAAKNNGIYSMLHLSMVYIVWWKIFGDYDIHVISVLQYTRSPPPPRPNQSWKHENLSNLLTGLLLHQLSKYIANTRDHSELHLPMAEQLWCGTPCLLGVWVCGRSWVRAPAGAIVRRVFRPTRKLVRFSLLKCPSIPNSKQFWNM